MPTIQVVVAEPQQGHGSEGKERRRFSPFSWLPSSPSPLASAEAEAPLRGRCPLAASVWLCRLRHLTVSVLGEGFH